MMKNDLGIEIIYLDMDGVKVNNLADLARREKTSVETLLRERDRLRRDDENFDYIVHLIRRHLPFGHFETCDPLPHLPVLKRMIRRWLHNGIRVEILSSGCSGPDIFPEICRQKDVWLAKHGLDILPANYARGSSHKHDWAAPKALLIDDYGKNCSRWIEAGGHAVKFETMEQALVDLQEMGLV